MQLELKPAHRLSKAFPNLYVLLSNIQEAFTRLIFLLNKLIVNEREAMRVSHREDGYLGSMIN